MMFFRPIFIRRWLMKRIIFFREYWFVIIQSHRWEKDSVTKITISLRVHDFKVLTPFAYPTFYIVTDTVARQNSKGTILLLFSSFLVYKMHSKKWYIIKKIFARNVTSNRNFPKWEKWKLSGVFFLPFIRKKNENIDFRVYPQKIIHSLCNTKNHLIIFI